MSKHTPGPWAAHKEANGVYITERVRGRYCLAKCGDGSTEQHLIDARLMSAAPDLLAALRELEAFGEREDMPTVVSIASAAIAKAVHS